MASTTRWVGCSLLLVLACRSGKDPGPAASAATATTSATAAAAASLPTGGSRATTFGPKTLELDGTRLEAQVPQGWTETLTTGDFAEARYVNLDMEGIFALGTTCNGSCDASKWQANSAQQAKELLAFYADPKSYIPAADVEVKQNGETEPGHYVLHVRTQAKAPEEHGYARIIVKVWRYAPDWKSIVSCSAELPGDASTLAEQALAACHALKRGG